MAVEVILPKVDMDMTTGIISKWHVQNGDQVKKGQALFDMETDKSAIEIESPADGAINNLAETGKAIEIGKPVALIYASGEVQHEIKTPAATAPTEKSEPVAEIPKPIIVVANGTGLRATPLARRLAREKNISLKQIKGTGPRGRIVAGDVASSKPTATTAPPQLQLTITCDLARLLDLQNRITENIQIKHFAIKALALALHRVPAAYVTIADNGTVQDQLPKIENQTLTQIAKAAFEISSTQIIDFGVQGIEIAFAPAVPPHTTSLAIGAPFEQFVAVNKQPVLKTLMTCSLSCDTRAVDHIAAAELLQAFKAFIEEPALMLA